MTRINRRDLLGGAGGLAATLAAGSGLLAEERGKMEKKDFERRLGALRDAMRGHVTSGYVPGLVYAVHWHGDDRVEAMGLQSLAGAPMRRDSIFRIASIGKPITAATAMTFVEEGRIGLDDPVDRFLPELADRPVLRRIDGPLDDTVPARRPITLRDLLTLRFGLGAIMVWPAEYPIQKAIEERGLAPSAELFDGTPDTFMKRLGELPLAAQPGEQFFYHTGMDVAGVLIARIAGKPLGAVMKERIFDPLGMTDTGFFVPADRHDRLVTAYRGDPESGKLETFDSAKGGRFAAPPAFESGGGGQVSTVDDYLAFSRMLLGGGTLDGTRILSPSSVSAMTTDHLTTAQKDTPHAQPFFSDGSGWGFGMEVEKTGRFGWVGGYGTAAYCDPGRELVGVLMTQRLMDSPAPPPTMADFWEITGRIGG